MRALLPGGSTVRRNRHCYHRGMAYKTTLPNGFMVPSMVFKLADRDRDVAGMLARVSKADLSNRMDEFSVVWPMAIFQYLFMLYHLPQNVQYAQLELLKVRASTLGLPSAVSDPFDPSVSAEPTTSPRAWPRRRRSAA